ncbi:MAG: hypothetical protein JKY65_12845 [Planctomycetes bacterium]|nr:hypothetical protein [Planctomycetota bacterium]
MRTLTAGALLGALVLLTSPAIAKDYYVSAKRGKGKRGTKKKPSKNLGNVLKKLQPGDTIHVAGGVYLGRGTVGAFKALVPVSIIGGYSDDFSTRDPWGAHKTIFSGVNTSKNFEGGIRIAINPTKWNRAEKMVFVRTKKKSSYHVVIDGIIIDNSGRNRYKGKDKVKIGRMADPKRGEMPTPDRAGISVVAPIYGKATIRNCIVINVAGSPKTGAISMWGSQETSCLVENNLVVNNTGVGIFAYSGFHPSSSKGQPKHVIKNNTVLFTWKYDPPSSDSGHAFRMDSDTDIVATNNVFACSDMYGVMNGNKSKIKKLTMARNLLAGNVHADYREFNLKMGVDAWEDDSDDLSDDSEDNVGGTIKIPVSDAYKKLYLGRAIIDRNAKEADIKAAKSGANDLRRMLGQPVKGEGKADFSSDVWLHPIKLDDAIKAGLKQYRGKYGCKKP